MLPQSWLGKKIGDRYQIETILGQGGMSAVYRAVDPNLRRVVAIKLIHPHLSGNPKFVDRFKEEAAAVARLRHPNIVQVHDFDWDGENYYMVMEYLEGETLQARLKRLNSQGRYLSISEALQICGQICDAAGYAHNHDLVHRDIKPANIMLNLQGQAILMDFGIVKIVGGEYHTATGATIGTAMYMSPEQIRSERVDERSDIYALGVTLYEMLSGRPPYQADSAITLMMMVLNDPLPDLREIRKGIPSELQAVVEKALAKDLSQRFKTMAEMGAALQRVRANLEAPVPEITTVDESEVLPSEPLQPVSQTRTEIDTPVPEGSEFEAQEISKVSSQIPPAPSSDEAFNVPLPSSSGARVSIDRRKPRLRTRAMLASIGVIVLAVAVYLTILLINGSKPPEVSLAPIVVPTVPITAETAPYVVNLGIWDTASNIKRIAYSPNGEILGSTNKRDWLRYSKYRYYSTLWQIEAGSLHKYLLGNPLEVYGIAFSPEGDQFATGSDDGTISLWNVGDGSLIRTIEASIGGITGIAFSPNRKLLAASSWDGIVGLWQLSDGHLLRTMQESELAIRDVAFSPDGMTLAAGSDDKAVLIWRVSDGSLLYSLQGHRDAVHGVAYSTDGALLASASEDGTVILWQVDDGSLLRQLEAHTDPVYGVAFSPDGSLVASGSLDRTLILWRVNDGHMVSMPGEHADAILSVKFSPDGRLLVSGCEDGKVYFWGISAAIPMGSGP